MQFNKAIVGKNAFAHESGIHQDGMLKNAQTYEIMTPESVGIKSTSLVMGKHSGRHAFKEKLQDLGYRSRRQCSSRKRSSASRISPTARRTSMTRTSMALVDDEVAGQSELIKVVALTVIAGTGGPQKATLTLDVDGKRETREATGNGPVDATFNAIKAIFPNTAKLSLYQVHAVTEGTDAQAEVSVRLEEDGKFVTARAADPDTLVASAKAYVSAINKLTTRRAKSKPGVLKAV